MAARFSEEVVVRIWHNINNRAGLPTAHFGHASTSLRGPLVGQLIPLLFNEGADDYVHISCWPGAGAGKNFRDAFRPQNADQNARYAHDADAEIGFKAAAHLMFHARHVQGRPGVPGRRDSFAVPQRAQFRTASYLGRTKVRSSTIRAIDAGLKKYERYGWNNPAEFTDKLSALIRVMENVFEHNRSKPGSRRAPAVIRLGFQGIRVLSSAAIRGH